ncbi:MAG TPA: ABC transporter ATP-binding protein [Gaiellaceae bacterium]|nr:ABC transporter ATP-binding protein [Gaiellaceae bacterium]
MRQITKRFPGVLANDRVDFEAEEGEVHALLGENGAGKTTLMNVLTGLYRPDEGEIQLYGETVNFHSPRDALDAGIGMVHQHFRLVETLTVAENLMLGWHTPRFWLGAREGRRQVREVSESLQMQVDSDARIWQLSVGEQQRVEIIKVVFRGSRVLILDEPTAVLTPQEAEQLFNTLRIMAREGHSVIVITHKLHEVMSVADRITVLRGGRSVATVSVADVTPRSLAALMVGREISEARRVQRTHAIGEPVLEVESLTAAGDRGGLAVKDLSLVVRSGEIVGVAGVAGNGQRELAETVYGIRPAEMGWVRVGGRALRRGDPRSAISAAVAHVPEDRLGTGLAPSLSVAANVSLKSYRGAPVSRGPLLLVRKMRELALALIRRYDIKAPGPDTPVRNLSGGNLQKLVLGREFEGEPRVLIAAQPTRGLDVGAIETVHEYLRDAASKGVAVLLISEDLDEIRALADRIVVMYEGALAGEVDAETASVEEIGLLMAGGRA